MEEALDMLRECRACPRQCGVNRRAGERGYCRIGARPKVSSVGPHFGEESVLVGRGGSGTIFFAGCNLRCVFCQNFDISQLDRGREVEIADLAEMMLKLEAMGCENVNFVSPSHVAPQVLAAIVLARERGLGLPTVYNCGGYDRVEMLRRFEGLIDVYMPDVKYGDDTSAAKYSDAPDYVEVNRVALREMHRQVGDLALDGRGVARKGLLVRHLVMPEGLAGSSEVLDWLAEEISPHTFVNVMEQYRPCYRAEEYPELSRRITPTEYRAARDHARSLGLRLAD